MWWEKKAEGILIRLWVQPGAKSPGPAGLHGERLKFKTAAPPVEGKANKEVIARLAHILGISEKMITLKSGEKSRAKDVLVRGVTSDQVAALIQNDS